MIEIEAHDEIELVGRATHERFIIDSDRFEARLRQKTQKTRKTQKTQNASSQSLGGDEA